MLRRCQQLREHGHVATGNRAARGGDFGAGWDIGAQRIGEFRRVVGEYPFPQAGTTTVSVGFTAIEVGDTPAAAFERADRAVYHAKNHGRNQVSNHAELIRQGLIASDKRVSDVELF